MPLIDFLIKIEAVLNFLLLPFSCCVKEGKPLKLRVQIWMKESFEEAFNINQYELENYKKQKQYT
jgi:hypothetical protein